MDGIVVPDCRPNDAFRGMIKKIKIGRGTGHTDTWFADPQDRFSRAMLRATRSACLWALLPFISVLPASLSAQDFEYRVSGSELTITNYIGAGGPVSIPTMIAGFPVTAIENLGVLEARNLTSLTIPETVTTIEATAFSGCHSLLRFAVHPNNNFYSGPGGILFNKGGTDLIQYPKRKVGDNYLVPEGVVRIGPYAFYDQDVLSSITMADSVTTIGEGAFRHCGNLTQVEIGNGVTEIGNEAFYYCRKLTTLTLGSNVTNIGDWAFYFADELASVVIPDSATSIGDSAFEECSSLSDDVCAPFKSFLAPANLIRVT